MTIADKAVLITGSSRGIGRALVDEALERGARRVYAATRAPLAPADPRVSNVILDVTRPEVIERAVAEVDWLDVLINNAGVALYDDLTDRAAIDAQLAVNLFGTYEVTRAFLPLLARAGGAVVNNLSINSFAALPVVPAYSISKAAAFSLTQAWRSLLGAQGVSVHAVMTGPVDTDMSADLDVPKASPQAVARAVYDGLERGEDEIFPDPMAAAMADGWRGGAAKALEREFAAVAGFAASHA